MYIDDVSKKLESGEYHTKKPFNVPGSKEELCKARDECQQDARRRQSLFQEDLTQCFLDAGVPELAASKLTSLAWNEGHCHGLHEVLIVADNLMEVVEAWVKVANVVVTVNGELPPLSVNPKTLLFEHLTADSVRVLKTFSDEVFQTRKLNYQHPVIQLWYAQHPTLGGDRLAVMLDVLHQKILASIVEYFMAGGKL